MTAKDKNLKLQSDFGKRFDTFISMSDAGTLRRAELTLHRWHELECGDSSAYCSRCIERNENTDKPYLLRIDNKSGIATRTPIYDREKGAIKRVKAICDNLGLFYYVQSDPRGCALYVAPFPLNDRNYTDGMAFCS